jgi:predicted nucleotidyltransferase
VEKQDFPPDFRDLLSALAASGAEYLIVGGWAVSFHAEPRFTKDLDLLIGSDDLNLQRVVAALTDFGAPPAIIDQLRQLRPDEFLVLGVPPARVDLLRSIPGVDFAAAYGRRVSVDWDGVPASIVGREDLLASKRAAGREKDLKDVRLVERAARTRRG